MNWCTRSAFGMAAALLFATSVSPVLAEPILSLSPTTTDVVVGQAQSIDVLATVSGGEYIGAYDVWVTWDPAVLSLSGVSFDGFLDGPADSLSGWSEYASGAEVFEVSLSALVNQSGAGTFRLFSLSFLALAVGSTSIAFDPTAGPIVADAMGALYESVSLGSAANVRISSPTSVPEPPALAMFSLGILSLVVLRGASMRRR